ncbi:NAD(+) synthase [Tissierella creatinophila]|uniref:NH(3)-dependent NAD(+) synthetase n=1 Tax=Tissierella creatinophila DSM 6911 TaxID=1123403 RepID=A0A1U7M2B4_TISCR|nr:NAD(+) synthase [Tissierella creatinophila]OLS01454.1 NH(3)-dependent NAD(+) synthetase [Tissierella creatinophila DSM 6911]
MKLQDETLKEIVESLTQWIRDEMEKIGGKKMILGISGGKDSSVVAALGVRALGRENVIGVLMPKGEQIDIDFSYDICEFLGIENVTVPIDNISKEYLKTLEKLPKSLMPEISNDTSINLSPRIRMTILYAISQSIEKSRVVHTGNLSEKWIGYTTVYGDNTGAFSPLGSFTSDEVIQIGRFLNLPEKFIVKPPADGLTGKTDEMVIGFSYDTLNKYIRTGEIDDLKIKEKIDKMYNYSRFKFTPIPIFPNDLPIKE